MALKAPKEYNGKLNVELVERDGKYVLEFDDMPSLIFVSFDGNGSTDALLVDGCLDIYRRNVTIKSEVGALTTYDVERYAITVE